MDLRAEERSRIYRLAWDFVGSGLAGRNALYERFYLGSPAVCYQMAHIQAPKQRARGLVQHILGMTP
jgi:aromatic ring hydroxylase